MGDADILNTYYFKSVHHICLNTFHLTLRIFCIAIRMVR